MEKIDYREIFYTVKHIDFTDIEVLSLTQKGWEISYDNQPTSNDYYSTNNFRSTNILKLENGMIKIFSINPINVDMDTGKYDSEHETLIFRNLEEYLAGYKPIFKESIIH